MNNKILIIGKVPPPIGGVTIHVKRLVEKLDKEGFDYHYINLSNKNLFRILKRIFNYGSFHLHTSNVYLQFLFSLLSKIFIKNSIITYHGDLQRYVGYKYKLLILSIRLCKYPITLNDSSLNIAIKKNKNTLKISAFIPPENEELLSVETKNKIDELKSLYEIMYSTNAYSLTYDKNGTEIYGIIDLISFFNENNQYALVVSDPSGAYYEYVANTKLKLGDNILILNFPHSFCEVLKLTDASIRNTSTDGDSLSIKESLFYKKLTFATNVVDRDFNVITYKRGDYKVFLQNHSNPILNNNELDGSTELLNLYKRINK